MSSEMDLSDWQTVPLSDVADISRGTSWCKDNERRDPEDGAMPVIGIRNVQAQLETDDLLWLHGLKPSAIASSTVRTGDILMVGSNGNPARIGNAVQVDEPGRYLYASLLFGLRPRRTIVDPDFLFQAIVAPSVQRAISDEVQGTTGLSNLKITTLRDLTIELPPLDEQRRIAEVLRSVDQAIVAAGDVICGLESAASEIAERAFADPDAAEPDCEVVTFGDLFDIKGGNQPPKSSFVYEPKEGYVRLLQIRDFESNDKAVYIAEKSTKARCEADDILIARYGASVGRILTGKAGAYNVALTKIVFRHGKMARRYAYHWLKSEYFQDRIRAVSNRSAQAGFNKEDLFPTKIALPTIAAQRDIAEALDDIEKAVWGNRNQREQLIELKGALLDDLLSGRVRVPA